MRSDTIVILIVRFVRDMQFVRAFANNAIVERCSWPAPTTFTINTVACTHLFPF
jgi:hypothetical protein